MKQNLQTTQKTSEDCLQKHETNHNVVFLKENTIIMKQLDSLEFMNL